MDDQLNMPALAAPAAAPMRLPCTARGCDFLTPASADFKEHADSLDHHVTTAHPTPTTALPTFNRRM